MAGSKKWFVYTADSQEQYAVQIDESNGEAADFEDYTESMSLPVLPKGFKMRSASVSRQGSNRSIWVGSPTSDIIGGLIASILLPSFQTGGFAASVAWNVISVLAEKKPRLPTANDTGMLDGDAD